jgi:hypothetical protein
MAFNEIAPRPNAAKPPLVDRVDLRLRRAGRRVEAEFVVSHDLIDRLGLGAGGRVRLYWGDGSDRGAVLLLPTAEPDKGRKVAPRRGRRGHTRVGFSIMPPWLEDAARRLFAPGKGMRAPCGHAVSTFRGETALFVELPPHLAREDLGPGGSAVAESAHPAPGRGLHDFVDVFFDAPPLEVRGR